MSIYDSIGGAPAVARAVDEFDARVLTDQQLVTYFAGVDLARLKAHQRTFIAAAVGGPEIIGAATWPPRTPESVSPKRTSTPLSPTWSTRSSSWSTGGDRHPDRVRARAAAAGDRRGPNDFLPGARTPTIRPRSPTAARSSRIHHGDRFDDTSGCATRTTRR